MNARGRACALVVVAALSPLVAGCSGGSKGLTRSALVTKANSLCTVAGADIKAVPRPTNVKDPAQVATYLNHVVPIVTRLTSQLAAMKPALEVRADWGTFVGLQQQEDAAFIGIQHKADANDPSALTELKKIPALNGRINVAATRVGATGCLG